MFVPPQKKSQVVKSGDLGGHWMSPKREMSLPGNIRRTTAIDKRAVCDSPFCTYASYANMRCSTVHCSMATEIALYSEVIHHTLPPLPSWLSVYWQFQKRPVPGGHPVNKEDVQGLNIIVFRPISRTDITVYVVAESPENLRSLRVKMFRDDTTVHSVRLSSLKATPSFALTSTALVFPPVPADGRVYSIQLESSLSQKTHNYRTHPVYFKANSSFQLVRLNFVTTSQTGDSELSHTSYLALPLVLIALLVLYNREAAQALLTRLLTATDNTSYSQLDDSSGEAVTVEPVKRKLKQRKT
ncbi:hypothetical protein J6590_008529 [Homalodisca vitripennis]|nr:hypothetical protein J6590_008529 [Homalodisca vitripennis]